MLSPSCEKDFEKALKDEAVSSRYVYRLEREDFNLDESDAFEKLIEEQQEAAADCMLEHLERKKLHDLLEATVDSYRTDEGTGGAILYHAFVCIFAHRTSDDQIFFGVLHPADDRDICPADEPAGFTSAWDFNAVEVAKHCRRLARAANAMYVKLGIGSVLDATAAVPKSLDGFLDGLDLTF